MPRRIADGIRRIVHGPRILAGRIGRFARTDLYLPALDVAELVVTSRGRAQRHPGARRSSSTHAPRAQAGGRRPSDGRGRANETARTRARGADAPRRALRRSSARRAS